MRVANVNMSQTGARCPQGLTQKNTSGLTLCGQSATGCQGTLFSALGLSYSRVCGQLRGYQSNYPDAFGPYIVNSSLTINQGYVDGASITYEHIWTYATGISYLYSTCGPLCSCPCNNGSTAQVPPYVGSDYYCETGYNAVGFSNESFLNDPLWDGQQCDGVEAPCCTDSNMPWFTKTLGETTTEDIQLRLCIDNSISDEETLLQLIELYVY